MAEVNTSSHSAAPAAVVNNFTGLAKLLLQSGVFDEKTISDMLTQSVSEKVSLIQVIGRNHKSKSRSIAKFTSETLELPFLDLDCINRDVIPEDLLSDSKKLIELRAIPLFIRGPKLFVGTSDPSNYKALDFFTTKNGKRVEMVVVDDAQIDKAVAEINGDGGAAVSAEDADLSYATGGDEDDADDEEMPEGDDNPVVRFVNGVLLMAIRKGASDIHFEPYEKFYRVRIRVDGAMQELTRPKRKWEKRIASRVKVISNLNISEKRRPQDGRMKLDIPGSKPFDFRVSTLPTMYGEKIVMRILDPAAASLGIDALGYEPEEKKRLLDAISRPYGMVLVTGPTGSGKTVSLYTCLNILNREDINISTAEDPCEIQMAGINQVNINVAQGMTFAAALKSFLRQDPDIIMVGEIRDEETAEISVKAAQTGHLVLATLHTNDAPKTISRLIEIGVKNYNVAAAVILITAQRLARRLCEVCKEEHPGLTAEYLIGQGMDKEVAEGVYSRWKPFRPHRDGCDRCNQGYKGRLGIYQVMPISEAIQKLVMDEADSMQIEAQSQRDGVKNLRQSGLLKVQRGQTSLEEILMVTNE